MKRIFQKVQSIVLGMITAMLFCPGASAEVVGTTSDGFDYIHRYTAPNGQEIYYTSLEEAEYVKPEDVNFDGHDDLVVTTARGASNFFTVFYVWDGTQYVRASWNAGNEMGLVNYALHPELGLVVSYENEGAAGAEHRQCLYRWNGTDLRCERMAISESLRTFSFEDGVYTESTDTNRVHVRVLECQYGSGERVERLLFEKTVPTEAYGEARVWEAEDAALWDGLR